MQGRLAESVAEQAKKLSVRINLASLPPMGLTALICLLLYGNLLMWAGFRIGSGQASPPDLLLCLPARIRAGNPGHSACRAAYFLQYCICKKPCEFFSCLLAYGH
ncbi:MAG: hypothetical protein LBP38_04960 [Desulfovibrio sp.]|nr:hypothetical protein [Desulfovibrio sp.]